MTPRDWLLLSGGGVAFAVVAFAWFWAGVMLLDWLVRP